MHARSYVDLDVRVRELEAELAEVDRILAEVVPTFPNLERRDSALRALVQLAGADRLPLVESVGERMRSRVRQTLEDAIDELEGAAANLRRTVDDLEEPRG